MKRNFQFEGISVIRWNGRLIDLHNAYDLAALTTDREGRSGSLNFTRNGHAINPDSLPSRVSLMFRGNVRVAFNDLCAIGGPLRHEGVEIAYFDEGCDWQSFLDEEIARRQEPQGVHVDFINGLTVRFYCDEALFAAE